jgi:hypothetical protein
LFGLGGWLGLVGWLGPVSWLGLIGWRGLLSVLGLIGLLELIGLRARRGFCGSGGTAGGGFGVVSALGGRRVFDWRPGRCGRRGGRRLALRGQRGFGGILATEWRRLSGGLG